MSSILGLADPIANQNLQIWNNAAFDDAAKPSPLSPERFIGKENLSPIPLRPFCATPFSLGRRSKVRFEETDGDGRGIDAEIEAVEREIGRLTARLEQLRAKKREINNNSKAAEATRGRVVPARFLTSKQTPNSAKIQRRGTSLEPSEILGRTLASASAPRVLRQPKMVADSPVVRRRGLSLGPAEISSATARSRQSLGTTRLKAINESSMKRNTNSKPVKALQPKVLFEENEAEKKAAAPSKTPASKTKSRVVPSRYSLVHVRPAPEGTSEGRRRKWSLPEREGDAVCAKRSCVSLPETTRNGSDEAEEEESPKWLPPVRTSRGVPETPRDSGPAKRVAELEGRRTHFGTLVVGREKGQHLDFQDHVEEEEEAQAQEEEDAEPQRM